jgi:hypothetical protein
VCSGLLGEDDLHAGAPELFEQQPLIGVAAREAVGRVAQQHLEAVLGGAVAQPLQRRASQRGAGEPLVLEHQLLRDQEPAREASKMTPTLHPLPTEFSAGST